MKTKHQLTIMLLVLLLAALACNLPGSNGYVNNLPDGLVEDYSIPLEAATLDIYAYSPDQIAVQEVYGNPTRFTIIFTAEGRLETWVYDPAGYQVVFADGDQITEQQTPPIYQENMYATIYTPALFYAGMSLDEIVAASGKADFVLTRVEGVVADGQLLHLEGLSVGVVDNQIRFVETLPATTETLLLPEDFSSN
jgi:hypothetical protein